MPKRRRLSSWLGLESRAPRRYARGSRRDTRRKTAPLRLERLEERVLLTVNEVGTEFHVNTVVSDSQQSNDFNSPNPGQTAMDADGNFVVVWQSNGNDGPNEGPTGNDDSSSFGVYFRIYSAGGSPASSERRVNITTAGSQQNAAVDMNADGDFVVVWESGTASDYSIFMRVFRAGGQPIGQTEIQVDIGMSFEQRMPSVAIADDGSFVVTWQSRSSVVDDWDIHAQRYDDTGNTVGGIFMVNSFTAGDQQFSRVSMDPTGNFAVSFTSTNFLFSGSLFDVAVRAFNADGTPRTNDLATHGDSISDPHRQRDSDVVMEDNGDFIVVFSENNEIPFSPKDDIGYTRFNANGTLKDGGPIQATDGAFWARDRRFPTIDVDQYGEFVISWSSLDEAPDSNRYGTFLRRFGVLPGATPIPGEVFLANTYTTGEQFHGTVASSADDRIVVVWTSQNQPIPGSPPVDEVYGIFGQRFMVDRPRANPDNASVFKNDSVVINLTGNDVADSPNMILPGTIVIQVDAEHGNVVVNANGTVTYTPDTGFIGNDNFFYTVKDNTGTNSNQAKVTVTVMAIPPTANPDSAVTLEDNDVLINILSNDTPGDPGTPIDPSTVSIINGPTLGSIVSVNPATGAVLYRPDPDLFGSDAFTYRVRDVDGVFSNVTTVSITITPVNDPPRVTDDTVKANNTAPVVINVLANDTDIDDMIDPTTVTIVTPPASAVAPTINPVTGAITYTPDAGFSGIDTFTYTVEDTLGAVSMTATVTIDVNDPPTAVDDPVVILEDMVSVIPILANDTDTDGMTVPSSVVITSGPAHGSVTINTSTGAVTYTPDDDYNGMDSFMYTVKDNDGAVSNQATVSITITPVNDPPVAVDDEIQTPTDTPILFSPLTNDFDPDAGDTVPNDIDPNSLVITSGAVTAAGGTVIPFGFGFVTYTPPAGFSGFDTFTYTVEDTLGAVSNEATVLIRVGDTSTLSGEVFITGSGFPLEGVEVTITLVGGPTTYTDTVTTDATGSYTFMDLVAGTYKVTETHPAIFLDGPEFVGSGGGTVANDEFQNVMIGPGVDLTGYDFTELGLKPEFLNSYLGRRILQHADLPTSPGVDGLIMAAMDLGLDSFFLAFNAGIDGPLEFTALYNGSLGGVTLTLVDQNFNVVKTIAGSGNQAKMTVNGTPGVPLFLDITGTNPDVDLFAKDTTPPPVNHAPEFDPLDPLFVTEGETLQVVIPATDSDGDGLFYSLGSDAPEGAEIDSATGLLTWTPADSSPTPFEFTVIVADYGDPQQAAMRTVSVMVENADPTASVAGPTVAVPYQPRTFALIANDVSPDDQASDFTFHIDWDGDGVTDQTVAGPSGMEVQHEFTTIGSFEVRVQAVDQDGGASLLATHSIDISQTMLQADETDPSLTNLVFGGSAGTDFIVVMSNGDSISLLTVVLNGLVTLTTNSFSGVTGHVVGYAGAGTDSLLGYLAFGTWVEFYGGDGLDLLIGSSGDDLLDGGNDGDILSGLSGNDQLIGGSGRDLIIGGQGADALFGDMGEDLLLGDSTRMYDGNMTALLAIHKEWNSSRTMEERIANINGTGAGPRLNGDYFLNNATLRNDNAVDNLLGGSESDWILYRMFQDLLDDLGEDDEDTPLGQ